MQFADPAWQPGATSGAEQEQESPAPRPGWSPPLGTDAQAQTTQQNDAHERDYTQGYRAQAGTAPGYGETPQGQQPFFQAQPQMRGGIPTWVWIVIVIALLGGGGPFFSFGGGPGHIIGVLWGLFIIFLIWSLLTRRLRINVSGEAQPAETRTFEVSTQPTIVINNKAGSIRLHAGQEGQVSISTTKRGYVFSPQWDRDSQVWYNHDSAANTVSARVDNWKLFGKNAIDFDIAVPAQANLELVTNAGTVSVQNVAGQMKLQSDAGSISATQVTLYGKSRLKTDAGSVTFVGSLDPDGDYHFTTDLGSINVTLPADASFDLEARTDLGSINTNLPLQYQQKNKASGKVGIGPYPRLKAKTDLGSVRVYRA